MDKKSCENCMDLGKVSGFCYSKNISQCDENNGYPHWKPNYPTLQAQNAELIHLLEKIKPSYCGLFCAPDEHEGFCKEITEVLGRVKP